ncbi:hypothetical protein B296_00008951 [Ensete ventricosum]|uniref:Uncharacterized protein n=1 Tax=Ensete ventricosum TaxID=4639 RepID=A0A427AH41_ENSVE|nr:hypothetical protein B296_00008951 [Ensete ventricosum]
MTQEHIHLNGFRGAILESSSQGAQLGSGSTLAMAPLSRGVGVRSSGRGARLGSRFAKLRCMAQEQVFGQGLSLRSSGRGAWLRSRSARSRCRPWVF